MQKTMLTQRTLEFRYPKLLKLKKILRDMGSVLIAYSGGVDSTFLLKVAHSVLGEKNVMAVTAKSPTYTRDELEEAKKTARKIGVGHLVITTAELLNPRFRKNPVNRCYWCKKELFGKLKRLAEKYNLKFVLDGSNSDDMSDYRPGRKAAFELDVRSPLVEAGFRKIDIRRVSKKIGLHTWDKPNLACLASRFPYGMNINKKKLGMVNDAENFLRTVGHVQVRVRHHGNIARIEVPKEEIDVLLERKKREKVIKRFKELGYKYVTVDLEGYRTGSMNIPNVTI